MTNINYQTLLQSLIKKLGSDILVIDMDGKILIWEHGFGGQRNYNAVGKNLRDLFPNLSGDKEGIDWELEIFSHVLTEGRSIEIHKLSRQVGNKTLWFDIFLYPLKTDGNVTGAVIVSLDVSKRTRLEDEVVRQARTQSLANLGASIAHEIRNPLNAMSLNLQLVREAILDNSKASTEEQVDNLNLILQEISRLDSIVSNFLQFARPQKTMLSLENPNEAVQVVISMLTEQARKQGVELRSALSQLPKIPMDKSRLVEAIFNLAQNAIQALKDHGHVEISTSLVKDQVLIRVQDNGPGITDDTKEKIFDLYFSTKAVDGTGLGLPYAERIVKDHHGSLSLETEVGKGSTFIISLPLSIITGSSS